MTATYHAPVRTLMSAYVPDVPDTAPGVRRLWWTSLLFLIPCGLCGTSYLCGGLPTMTDLGFSVLTALCGFFVIVELLRFPIRMGIGGICLYGGVIVWLCHDYIYYWLGFNFSMGGTFPAWVVAKDATWNCVLVFFMSLGLHIRRGRWMERLMTFAPEPFSPRLYWHMIYLMFLFAIIPYFVFTNQFGLVSMMRESMGSWLGMPGVEWTGGRTGNLNYDWHGYIAQWLEVGQLAGVLGVAYSIFYSPPIWQSVVCWLIWLFYLGCAFEGTRRGPVGYMMLPVMAFFFIKYQAKALQFSKKFSVKGYALAIAIGVIYFIMCQALASFRYRGYAAVSWDEVQAVDYSKSQGDSMFSEALIGYQVVGQTQPAFYDQFPGAAIVRPIPDNIISFFVGLIPRALWNDKPIDPVWAWYNRLVNGSDTLQGTTIAQGPSGHWYFRYGPWGVVEGGLLVGWLMGVSERAFRRTRGSAIGIVLSMGFATSLFRAFRDFAFGDVYTILMGSVVFWAVVTVANRLAAPTPAAMPEFA